MVKESITHLVIAANCVAAVPCSLLPDSSGPEPDIMEGVT